MSANRWQNTLAIIFMIVWIVRFIVGAVLDMRAAFGEGEVDESLRAAAHTAISAVWSLSPYKAPAFVVASYSIAALVNFVSIKRGLSLADARGVRAVSKRVLGWACTGIVILVLASVFGIVPLPESWLPGRTAEIRFTGIPVAIMMAELMLAHAAGLEVAVVRASEHGKD